MTTQTLDFVANAQTAAITRKSNSISTVVGATDTDIARITKRHDDFSVAVVAHKEKRDVLLARLEQSRSGIVQLLLEVQPDKSIEIRRWEKRYVPIPIECYCEGSSYCACDIDEYDHQEMRAFLEYNNYFTPIIEAGFADGRVQILDSVVFETFAAWVHNQSEGLVRLEVHSWSHDPYEVDSLDDYYDPEREYEHKFGTIYTLTWAGPAL